MILRRNATSQHFGRTREVEGRDVLRSHLFPRLRSLRSGSTRVAKHGGIIGRSTLASSSWISDSGRMSRGYAIFRRRLGNTKIAETFITRFTRSTTGIIGALVPG